MSVENVKSWSKTQEISVLLMGDLNVKGWKGKIEELFINMGLNHANI